MENARYWKPRIILVPYPAQGHVTPMQKLALVFLNHGFEPVVVLPQHIHQHIINSVHVDDQIKWVAVADGLDYDDAGSVTVPDFFGIESVMENKMPTHLEGLINHELDEEGGVACVVIDLLASWAIEVAKRCGVTAVGFWPAMLATYRLIASIPDLVRTGLVSDTGSVLIKLVKIFLF